MKLVFLLVVLGWTVVHAQLPKRCSSPNQWTAYRTMHNHAENTNIYERYYYDLTLKRKRHDEEIVKGTLRSRFQTFSFYDTQKEYRYSPSSQTCNQTALDRPFRIHGVQPNDTFLGEFQIGASFDGVLAMAWAGNRTEGVHTGRYVTTWTTRGCIPVTATFFGTEPGTPPTHESYYNVTQGVEPDMFNLPSACGK